MTNTALAEITFDAPPKDVLNTLIPIMWSSRILVREQMFEESPLRITVKGKHAVSFRSWGEDIRITIAEHGKGSRVQAESVSKVPTTIFDWGINKENLEILFSQLIVKCKGSSPLTIKEKTF